MYFRWINDKGSRVKTTRGPFLLSTGGRASGMIMHYNVATITVSHNMYYVKTQVCVCINKKDVSIRVADRRAKKGLFKGLFKR